MNALEILTKDKLKITIEPDAGEMIRKIFFLFLKMEPLFFFFFLNIFIDYAITVVPFPPRLHSILPTPLPPTFPPI